MASLSRFHKLAIVSLGAVGGGFAYYRLNKAEDEKKYTVLNSISQNYTSAPKWDNNWDHREPEYLLKPILRSFEKPEDENKYNEKMEQARSKAMRHIIMIRHGQYNLGGKTDKERILTELGRKQADLTGQRLAALGIKWDLIVRSTMTRAQETARLIEAHLPKDIEVKDCQLIEEGAPIQTEPPVSHWKPEQQQFFQDGARIEAGFRKYFHRAPPDQVHDSYTLLVCHANVIRYYVCRALQFPPEGWLRMSLHHGSITWITITGSGRVSLRSFSDSGFMEPQYVTHRNKLGEYIDYYTDVEDELYAADIKYVTL